MGPVISPMLTAFVMSNDDLHDELDQLAHRIEKEIQTNEEFLTSDEVHFDPKYREMKESAQAVFG